MTESDRADPMLALLRLRAFPGCVRGLSQPALLAWLQCSAVPGEAAAAAALLAALAPHLPAGCTLPAGAAAAPNSLAGGAVAKPGRALAQAVADASAGLQEAAGLPVYERARVLGPDAAAGAANPRWALLLPTWSAPAAAMAVRWLVQVVQDSGAALALGGPLTAVQIAAMQGLLRAMARHAPSGVNSRHLLRAAHQLQMPITLLPQNVVQYGWGSRARWLDSTVTDATSAIAVKLARSKPGAAAILRRAGIPVPAHVLVDSVESALQAAARQGYPVVVKPADLDGGVAVSAGLQCEDEVRLAYERARRVSANVLVEQHVQGRDYRLIVFQGQMIWANERIPAGVTGDGAASIAALVAQANRDPRRGLQAWAQMHPITLGAEALELLAAAHCTPTSVPAPGQFVRLRRAANVSSGGTPVGVFDRVHPDNARLAVRAAQLLRLDLAGIDLLLPDISRSWRETGGAICEVNAQPGLGITSPHLFGEILARLVPGAGRIPVVVWLTLNPAPDGLPQVAATLGTRGVRLGVSSGHGLASHAGVLGQGRQSPFGDAHALLIDPAVDAIVLVTDGREWLDTGLPVDRFDLLLVSADWQPGADQQDILASLAPHCTGPVWMAGIADTPRQQLARSFGAPRLRDFDSGAWGPTVLVQEIEAIAARLSS